MFSRSFFLITCTLFLPTHATQDMRWFPDPYVVNGNDVPVGVRYPFVYLRNWNGAIFCGGTIIKSNYVITAAHCSSFAVDAVYGTRYSSNTQSEENEIVQIKRVKNKIVHPGYDSKTLENDIAILELQEMFNDETPLAKIDRERSDISVRSLTIVGMGVTNARETRLPEILQRADIRQVTCPNYYTQSYDYLCARIESEGCTSFCGLGEDQWGRTIDACYGDSGGPVYSSNENSLDYYLVGITSWGVECALGPDYPGVYVLIHAYTAWIDEVVGVEETCEFLGDDIYNEFTSKMFSSSGAVNEYDFFMRHLIQSKIIDIPEIFCQ